MIVARRVAVAAAIRLVAPVEQELQLLLCLAAIRTATLATATAASLPVMQCPHPALPLQLLTTPAATCVVE